MYRRLISSIALSAAALVACAIIALSPALAAAQTQNYSPAVEAPIVVPFHISGQYAADTTSVLNFKMPFAARLISVQTTARANGANTPTLAVDVKVAGNSVLSAPISVTTGTPVFGTISTPAVADEAAITVDFDLGGGSGSPTFNDITIVFVFVRT